MIIVNNKEELVKLILRTIRNRGFGVNLNFIDTSRITDMSDLFCKIGNLNYRKLNIMGYTLTCIRAIRYRLKRSITGKIDNDIFQLKIDKWDTSNVKDMSYMFESSRFNQNISDWDVRNVRDMSRMFSGAMFDHDIGQWNVKNLIRAREIFGAGSKFNHNLFIWTTKCPDNINLRELIPERLLVRLPINLWIEYDNSTYY